MALSLIAINGPDLRPLPLMATSELDYTLSGSINNTTANLPINGRYNVSLSEFSKEGYSFMAFGTYQGYPDIDISNPPPFFWKQEPPGTLIGYGRIQTPIGEKSVSIWLKIDPGQLIFYDVGIESSIVYRMVVSSPQHHYCYALSFVNNSNLGGYDNLVHPTKVHAISRPSEVPQVFWCGSENGSEMYGGYSSGFGSLEIASGERLSYEIRGNMSSAFIFDSETLSEMHTTGAFLFNSTLSRTAGNPGMVDAAVQPGTYWFLFEFRSNGRVAYYWQ